MSSHLFPLFSPPFHLTALLPPSAHQSTYWPRQQYLNHYSKALSHSLSTSASLAAHFRAPASRTTFNEPRLPALPTSQWQSRLTNSDLYKRSMFLSVETQLQKIRRCPEPIQVHFPCFRNFIPWLHNLIHGFPTPPRTCHRSSSLPPSQDRRPAPT